MVTRRQRNAQNQKKGALCESIVRNRLLGYGVPFLQPIHNGWTIHRRGGAIVGATPSAKVAGDLWGVLPSGRALLVEVKERPGSLPYGACEPHQHHALKCVHEAGGMAVVAWVTSVREVLLLPYPFPGWVKGKGISLEAARDAQLTRVDFASA